MLNAEEHVLGFMGEKEETNKLNQLRIEYRMFSAYLDPGPIESVVPRNELPEFDVKPSVGSRRGQEYVTANGARICNEGEQTVGALTVGYKPVRMN